MESNKTIKNFFSSPIAFLSHAVELLFFLQGAIVGLGTGAIATVAKPVQGIFDLVGGTASAVKEMVGGPSRKARFAESRIRLPRVTRNLQGLLPCYSETLADAQQQLLRINGYNTNETYVA